MNQNITLLISCQEKGKIYNIEIDADSLVEELIAEFTELLNASNQSVSFLYHQRRLEPKQSFRSQGVVKGSQLELILKHHGGYIIFNQNE
ncbi:unnamed protein product [Paramecium sonneborni]|uniref:Ubiquitin-like domain-containing protein n=1 Tax=Paramecium sonneborni TaxID=65129 RepID=A0A8S1RI45_9CILI|nr:unnamed protein product [Paramecium sonneborni]